MHTHWFQSDGLVSESTNARIRSGSKFDKQWMLKRLNQPWHIIQGCYGVAGSICWSFLEAPRFIPTSNHWGSKHCLLLFYPRLLPDYSHPATCRTPGKFWCSHVKPLSTWRVPSAAFRLHKLHRNWLRDLDFSVVPSMGRQRHGRADRARRLHCDQQCGGESDAFSTEHLGSSWVKAA